MFMSRKTWRPASKPALETAAVLMAFLFATPLPVAGSSEDFYISACGYGETDSLIWYGIERMSWDNLLVMVILAVMAIRAIIVTVERSVAYQTSHRENASFQSIALTALYYNRPFEVFEVATRFKRSPIAAVVASCSSRPGRVASGDSGRYSPDPTAPLLAQETSLKEGLMSLALIGRTAPLLGALLGILVVTETAWGAYRFGGSGSYPFLDASPAAGVGLVFGLLVGLFATWASCILNSRAERILLETKRLAPSILTRAWHQSTDASAATAVLVAGPEMDDSLPLLHQREQHDAQTFRSTSFLSQNRPARARQADDAVL
jgi:hypothetical protein